MSVSPINLKSSEAGVPVAVSLLNVQIILETHIPDKSISTTLAVVSNTHTTLVYKSLFC